MDGEKIIKDIECVSAIDMDWYYHAFLYRKDNFQNMITQGIKCNKLLGKKDCSYTHNGRYFISLSKIIFSSKYNSSFQNFFEWPSFIVGDIKATKCIQVSSPTILGNTIFPIRFSSNFDEYQAYRIIEPDRIAGLRCCLLNWYRNGLRAYLENIREMILSMREHGIELPIYDYSRFSERLAHVIDQNSYLDKCDVLIEEAREKGLKKHY